MRDDGGGKGRVGALARTDEGGIVEPNEIIPGGGYALHHRSPKWLTSWLRFGVVVEEFKRVCESMNEGGPAFVAGKAVGCSDERLRVDVRHSPARERVGSVWHGTIPLIRLNRRTRGPLAINAEKGCTPDGAGVIRADRSVGHRTPPPAAGKTYPLTSHSSVTITVDSPCRPQQHCPLQLSPQRDRLSPRARLPSCRLWMTQPRSTHSSS